MFELIKKYDLKRRYKGFTLVELLVVSGMIIILTTFVLASYRMGEREFSLNRAVHQVSQDIRVAQEKTMSGMECQECGGGVPPGYGIYFRDTSPNNTSYILYADENGDEIYTAGEEIETIELEKGVVIIDIKMDSIDSNQISINFRPPDPVIKIKRIQSDNGTETKITFALETDYSKTRTITINKAGLIDID